MKLFVLLSLFSFLLVGCKDTGDKIQKNSDYRPACSNGSLASCIKSNPACGTESGSGEIKIYCIDDDDTILNLSPYCGNHSNPSCKPI